MKLHNRRRKQLHFMDPDFADALYGGESGCPSSDRQAERKARQFCRQVQRILNLALSDRDAVEGISGLFVDDVTPAPDCGRLLVHVYISDRLLVADAIGALRRQASRLRSEVAAAISRKRAPELSFVPVFADGGNDE